jgi:peptidoglycan/xylan/chitin deacetylase (PgdA/CDA1 family)
MKAITSFLIVTLLATISGCSAPTRSNTSPPPISKCQSELSSSIPEMAAFFKAKGKVPTEPGSRPLEGMEIVLTVNRMILSSPPARDDRDDACYEQHKRENFDKILDALKQNQMPPTVSFIAGHAFEQPLLEEWASNGNLIGNMTYGRFKAKKGTADEFIASVERNSEVLAPVWEKNPPKHKFFRYPGLKLDDDPEKMSQIRAYLKKNGYFEVPATIDSRDGLFAQLYCSALARQDQSCASFIKESFKSLLIDKTLKAREAARQVAGRDIKHVLMIEANQLTADTLGELIAGYKSLGARFVSIEEITRDPFYTGDNSLLATRDIIKQTLREQLSIAETRPRPGAQ